MARNALVLALLVVLAPIARAEDDKDWKWDPKSHPKPKAVVGDKWFRESDETTHFLEEIAGKKPQKREVTQHTVYRFTGETVKIETDRASENRFKIEKWSVTVKGEVDGCLEGKSLVVTGTGADMKWELVEKDVKVTDVAKRWIGKELAKKPGPGAKADEDDDDKKKLLFPEKAIGDGEEWTRDPLPIAKMMLPGGLEYDVEKCSFTGKLTKLRVQDGVHLGNLDMKLVVAIKPGKEWNDAGKLELDFSVDGSLEEDKSQAASEQLKIVYELNAHRQGKDGPETVKRVQTNQGAIKHGPITSDDKKPDDQKKDEPKMGGGE